MGMNKYRENLLALAKGETPPQIPFIGYQEREINVKKHVNSSYSSSNQSGSKMQGFGNTNYEPSGNQNDNNNGNDAWNELGSWASTIAAKTTAVASDLAQKSKTAAVIASERAAKLKDNFKDEEYQQNLKKNVNETWNKTANTLSSWWSTAATAINENLGDGTSMNGIPKLHNNEEMEQMSKRKRMPSLSSDQYFNNNQ